MRKLLSRQIRKILRKPAQGMWELVANCSSMPSGVSSHRRGVTAALITRTLQGFPPKTSQGLDRRAPRKVNEFVPYLAVARDLHDLSHRLSKLCLVSAQEDQLVYVVSGDLPRDRPPSCPGRPRHNRDAALGSSVLGVRCWVSGVGSGFTGQGPPLAIALSPSAIHGQASARNHRYP